MKRERRRLDQLLVERGLAGTREKAKALILAGQVKVDGQLSDKAGREVDLEARVEVAPGQRYVSRGGFKLEGALQHWEIVVNGKVCLDVGSSTGGFTDCLLQHGAAKVYAFDVGTGQLDWKLRNDQRVIVREQFNCRNLRPEDVGEKVDIAVCDVSFISAALMIPVMTPLMCDTGHLVILVKPQFEVGKEYVGKGGIVRDPALHEYAVSKVKTACEAAGWRCDVIESTITGAEGNREFLLYATH
jgi:23S rRNA (cytidine1920-2'-O)/16S rRNA (cytidine1409-2'-O)-methyltransferase